LCYSGHLEIFCGMLGRISQFSEILADAYQNNKRIPHQIILGDFNTMAHGIARLSPKYCLDHMRWKSLGRTEAEFWSDHILSYHVEHGEINTHLKGLGLPHSVLTNARNSGFFDPFDVTTDITLTNYWGLYQGKLDWVLLRGFHVLSKRLGNHDYSASDHKYLLVDVQFMDPNSTTHVHQYRRRFGLFQMFIILLPLVILMTHYLW